MDENTTLRNGLSFQCLAVLLISPREEGNAFPLIVIALEVLPRLQYAYRCVQKANVKNMLEAHPHQKSFPWCIVMIIYRFHRHREATPSPKNKKNASPYMNPSQ
jgi:hypothetical protein